MGWSQKVFLIAAILALGQESSHWGGFDHHGGLKGMGEKGRLRPGDTELLRVSLKSPCSILLSSGVREGSSRGPETPSARTFEDLWGFIPHAGRTGTRGNPPCLKSSMHFS